MPEDETQKPAKIRLLSADAIKAIYEREMAKKGLPADCDEAKLEAIVKDVEMHVPPDVEIEYVSGDEIRNEDRKPLGNKVDISPSEQKQSRKRYRSGPASVSVLAIGPLRLQLSARQSAGASSRFFSYRPF